MSRPDRMRRAGIAATWIAAMGVVAGVTDLGAQTSTVVSREITVGGQGATLTLDLTVGRRLTIALEGGVLRIDGAESGTFPSAGPLDASWRALLAEALVADPDEIVDVLVGWSPPGGLTGASLAAAEAIRGRLRSALGVPAAVSSSLVPIRAGGRSALDLLFRSGRTRQVAAAAEGLPPGEVRVFVGEDAVVESGEILEASIVALESDVEVHGAVTGDIVVLGGTLTLGPGARVGGSVRTGDGTIVGNRSAVAGRFVTIPSESALANMDARTNGFDLDALNERIHEEVAEATRGLNRALRPSPGGGVMGGIGDGISGIVRVLLTFGILLGMGLGVLYFFPRQLDVVARTARVAPGASILVGAAGIVLALPLWVVGGLFLVASIIGIPALLVWIPGAPAALALAGGLGYLAIARNLGEWISQRDLPWVGDLDATRPAVQIGAGLALLLVAFASANVFEMAGSWLEVFEGVLIFVGVLTTVLGVVVGLGAVILSKAGTDSSHAGTGLAGTGVDAAGQEGIA